MKSNNFKYGSFDFEINIWSKKEYYEFMTLDPVEGAEGAVEIGWCTKPAHVELLYVFPVISGQISWQTYPENSALIPDDVQEQAQLIVHSETGE